MGLAMGMMFRNICSLAVGVLMLSAASSCVREDLERNPGGPSGPSDADGVDLTCIIDVKDLLSPLEVSPGTRAAVDYNPSKNPELKNIASLAFFIVEKDSPLRIRAYRMIAPDDKGDDPDKDGDGIYYLNKDPNTGLIADGQGGRYNTLIPEKKNRRDWETSQKTNDASYNGDDFRDDQHYGCWGEDKDRCVGYNGFAKLDGDNNLVRQEYGGVSYPAYDEDGLYDESYDSNNDGDYDDYTEYKAGDKMRKSEAVILTFKYDNPMHGPIEKLTRGDYYLIAVANFRESLSSVSYQDYLAPYKFTETGRTIGQEIYTLIREKWDPVNGITFTDFRGFMNGAVSLSEVKIDDTNAAAGDAPGHLEVLDGKTNTFIRSNRARLVSTGYNEITLTPGNTNIYSYSLIRNVARVTFRVSNYSAKDLTLSGFRLSDNFAQAATYLFHSHEEKDKLFKPSWQGAPLVSHTDENKAIVPFPAVQQNADVEGPNRVIPAGHTDVVFFDALVYESGNTGSPLGYYLTLGYPGVTPKSLGGSTVEYEYPVIAKTDDLMAVLEDGSKKFYINNSNRGGFKYYDESTGWLKSSNLSVLSALLEENYNSVRDYYYYELTKIDDKDGIDNEVIIKNIGANKYLAVPQNYGDGDGVNNRIMLVENREDATEFVCGDNSAYYGISLYFERKDPPVGKGYIHSLGSGNNFGQRLTWGDWPDGGSYYSFHQVVVENVDRSYPVSVFKEDVGVADDLYVLHRNDHLVVDISVTYNDKTQDVEYQVKPWDVRKNIIVFD